jgi:pimeloyl-ACP methyl ester carboxylesterase
MSSAATRIPSGTEAPLVLLPGTLCDARVFAPLLERLNMRDALVPDIAGAESAASMAALLLERLPPRFALVGFSLGGIVALEMIAQAPERIARLALIDTTARPDPPAHHPVRRNAVTRAAAMGLDRYATDKLWSLYASEAVRSGTGDRTCPLRALVTAMAVDAGIARFRQQSEIAIRRADSRPRLADITVPTLVLCGAEDRLCSPDIHREMADAIAGARLVIVPHAGHFALIEAPDVVAAEIRRWLDA